MKIYCFSGLGTDERVFHNLEIDGEMIIIPWAAPYPYEKLEKYAQRLSSCINTSEPFMLLGVSFGGMIASALSLYLKPLKTILISSAACRTELPIKIRLFRYFPLQFIPAKQFIPPIWMVSRFFGVKRGFFLELLRQIIQESDPHLVKWSVYQLVRWSQKTTPENLIRIHSDKDMLLPRKKNIDYDYMLKGGHFMVVEKHHNISMIINNILKEK